MLGPMSWPTLLGVLLYLVDLTIKIVALGVIPRNRRPSTGMAWLLLILTIPLLGFVIFLLLGSTRLKGKRHEQQRQVNELVAQRTTDFLPATSLAHLPGVRRVGQRPQPPARSPARVVGQQGGAAARLPVGHRRDGGRDPHGDRTSCTWSSTSPPGTR